MRETLLLHATAIALNGEAVLLRGPSGAGKSDLALRLIDAGGRLVADDQSALRREADRIVVSAPPTIAGLLEVRGIGIVRLDALAAAPVVLLVDLVSPEALDRLPLPRREHILGVGLPVLRLAPFESSASAKLRLAVRALTGSGPPHIVA